MDFDRAPCRSDRTSSRRCPAWTRATVRDEQFGDDAGGRGRYLGDAGHRGSDIPERFPCGRNYQRRGTRVAPATDAAKKAVSSQVAMGGAVVAPPMRGSVGIQQLRYETARLPFAIPSFAIVPGDAWTVGWRCLPLVFRMIGEIVRWGCEPVHSARAESSVRQVSRPELILVEPVALLPADLGIPPDRPLCEARQADSSRERLVSNLHPLSTAQHAGTRCARS